MQSITEFYNKMLISLGYDVTEDGFIKAGDALVIEEGLPVVVPSDEHIKTLTVVNSEGKVVPTKLLFNPLSENVLKPDSASIRLVLKSVINKIPQVIESTGSLLLLLANDKSKQKNNTLKLNEFMIMLSEIKNQKEIVNETTINKWNKIWDNYHKQNKPCNVFNKKHGKINGITYNRLASVEIPFYNELCNGNEEIMGVKISKTNIIVYKAIFDFLFPELNNENKIFYYGSNDGTSPQLISLLMLTSKSISKALDIANELKALCLETYQSMGVWELKEDIILTSSVNYAKDLVIIPTERKVAEDNVKANINPSTIGTDSSFNKYNQANSIGLGSYDMNQPQQEMSAMDKYFAQKEHQQKLNNIMNAGNGFGNINGFNNFGSSNGFGNNNGFNMGMIDPWNNNNNINPTMGTFNDNAPRTSRGLIM